MAAADQKPHVSAVHPRSYQDESYLHGFLGTVGDLQKDGAFQDVVLEVEGRRFPCHRLVLSAASPYFRAMFTSDMAESRQKTVVLQGLDAGMFWEILSYIYSGTLHVSLDKVQPLYQAADLLQLDYVRDTCSSYMAMNVERSTCVDQYKFADVFSIDIVRKACLQLIHRNFVEVASSDEFCSLSVNQLTEIISHDELDVEEETTVYGVVLRWVQHSKEDRLHHLPSILPHIRFNLLTSDDKAAILEHPLVTEYPGSSDYIRNAVQNGNPNQNPRVGLTMEMALLFSTEPGSNEILFMNPQEGKYISCSYNPEGLPDSSAMTVTTDNNIYILETKELENENQLSLYNRYNHAKNLWENEAMSSVCKWPGKFKPNNPLVEVNGILYHIAGVRNMYWLQMRKYNWHTNQWQDCAELRLDDTDRYSAVLPCGAQLYFLTREALHCYDPREDKWSKRTAPWVIYEVDTAVVMGTEIFCTDCEFTQTMVYDTESDCWQKLPGWESLHVDESDIDLCLIFFALENQLHVLLSYNNEFEDVYRVYVYDRSADTWRDLKATLPNKSYAMYGSHPVARISLPYLNGE
ncbi:kelch-like protein 21 [Branchiostoma floridae]|uniref:Kelch-like protein 21 n=1 Tax=Branchiostoma floridae TaxID=7739 RepID=A0A9J7LTH8_BRAFL|nr:kelch-like protein 21 [Branchiostoma floridae]